jgi:hypothetical protein
VGWDGRSCIERLKGRALTCLPLCGIAGRLHRACLDLWGKRAAGWTGGAGGRAARLFSSPGEQRRARGRSRRDVRVTAKTKFSSFFRPHTPTGPGHAHRPCTLQARALIRPPLPTRGAPARAPLANFRPAHASVSRIKIQQRRQDAAAVPHRARRFLWVGHAAARPHGASVVQW